MCQGNCKCKEKRKKRELSDEESEKKYQKEIDELESRRDINDTLQMMCYDCNLLMVSAGKGLDSLPMIELTTYKCFKCGSTKLGFISGETPQQKFYRINKEREIYYKKLNKKSKVNN